MKHGDNTVYAVIDEVLGDLETVEVAPVGALGKVFSALDNLRASRAPSKHIYAAERISLAMHRWEQALRKQDEEGEQTARQSLAMLTDEWADLHASEANFTQQSEVA